MQKVLRFTICLLLLAVFLKIWALVFITLRTTGVHPDAVWLVEPMLYLSPAFAILAALMGLIGRWRLLLAALLLWLCATGTVLFYNMSWRHTLKNQHATTERHALHTHYREKALLYIPCTQGDAFAITDVRASYPEEWREAVESGYVLEYLPPLSGGGKLENFGIYPKHFVTAHISPHVRVMLDSCTDDAGNSIRSILKNLEPQESARATDTP